MYIVEVFVNPDNPYGYKMKFEFYNYSDYSDFIHRLINTDYSYLVSNDNASIKES